MTIQHVKLPTAIKRYLTEDPDQIKAVHGTKVAHASALQALLRVCGSQLRASELKAQHFDLALKDLHEGASPEEAADRARLKWAPRRGRSVASLRTPISVYRKFYTFLVRREYISANRSPVAHLKGDGWQPQKAIHEVVMEPTAENYDLILKTAEARHPRERAACALALWGAFRDSEICALKVGGVDFEKETIRVWRKKQKAFHVIPMIGGMRDELKRWFAWLERNVGDLNPEWFVIGAFRRGVRHTQRTTKDVKLAPVDPTRAPFGVGRAVAKIVKEAGMPDVARLGAHTLRRMAALMVTEETGDTRMTMALLGHKQLATTEIYLQHSDGVAKLRAAMAARRHPDGGQPAAPGGGLRHLQLVA